MTDVIYPVEVLDEDVDDGTMPENVAALASSVIGRRIVKAEQRDDLKEYDAYGSARGFVITLDDGTQVVMTDGGDCCAYTGLEGFLLHPELVDHIIIGVGTTGEYTTWHIYADLGDVLELTVGWSAGNIGYYGYGFDIRVVAA